MRILSLLLFAPAVFAQAIVTRGEPVRLGLHRVTATIEDRVAAVTVEQTFRNPTQSAVEGTYVFPLPRGAAVSDFAMTIGDKLVRGEILDARRARDIYLSIVRRRKDPGLLEYVGRGLFRARVFPIAPKGEVSVRLSYQQLLPEEEGVVEFRYPLATERVCRDAVDSVVVDVRYESSADLKTVYSPTLNVAVDRKGERFARVSYESAMRRQRRDLHLYFGRSPDEVGFSLLSHKPAGEEGTFLAVLAPRIDAAAKRIVPKDVVYLLDKSGSMKGSKLRQAKAALAQGIGLLREGDRFNVIAFATDYRRFQSGLVPATEESKKAAQAWLNRFEAAGGTAMEAVLKHALKLGTPDRLFMVALLTDGRPTVGITDPAEILEQLQRANAGKARVFTFGVGEDLDVMLLDRIAEQSGGVREYVEPGQEIGHVTNRFFRRIDRPVLTDLSVEFGGGVQQVYPRRLGDLFAGDQIVLLGRYAEGGERAIRLRGKRGEEEVTFEHRTRFRSDPDATYLPRLWAARKIAFLLDEIRLHGENKELAEEVATLAKRYSIITPYTAGLVLEDAPPATVRFGAGGAFRGPNSGIPPGLRLPSDPDPGPPPPTTPGDAPRFFASKDLKKRKGSAVIEEGVIVRTAVDTTFRRDRKRRWVDTAWDGKSEPKQIEAYSDEYFALLDKDEKIARYLAVGERVLFVFDGQVYEVVPAKS